MKMDFPAPYKLADKAISFLNKRTVLRFSRVSRAFQHDNFDELSVYRNCEELYAALMEDNEVQFRELCVKRYQEIFLYLKRSWPDRDDLDDLVEMYLANLLTTPNEQTHYAYDAECLRKRDRAVESVNAAPTKSEKDLQFEKAMRYWSQQTGFYIDIIADDMALKAMKDCGVKEVIWHTQGDGRVCDECKDRDGETYSIDKVPPKPHLRCRCWLEPVM